MKVIDEILKPLSKAPLQAYLDDRVQLFDVIEKILREIGPSEVYISTFSTSEEFLRRIFRLKQEGLITYATLWTDLKAAKKTVNLYRFISQVFDEVNLGENHSKVVLFRSKNRCVSVCTSQNQTRGNRAESGMISTSPELFESLLKRYLHFSNHKSININALYR